MHTRHSTPPWFNLSIQDRDLNKKRALLAEDAQNSPTFVCLSDSGKLPLLLLCAASLAPLLANESALLKWPMPKMMLFSGMRV